MTPSNCFPQNMTTYGRFSLENPLDRSQPLLCFVTKWQKIATEKKPWPWLRAWCENLLALCLCIAPKRKTDKINVAESLARQQIFDLPWCSIPYTYTTHRLCWPLCERNWSSNCTLPNSQVCFYFQGLLQSGSSTKWCTPWFHLQQHKFSSSFGGQFVVSAKLGKTSNY